MAQLWASSVQHAKKEVYAASVAILAHVLCPTGQTIARRSRGRGMGLCSGAFLLKHAELAGLAQRHFLCNPLSDGSPKGLGLSRDRRFGDTRSSRTSPVMWGQIHCSSAGPDPRSADSCSRTDFICARRELRFASSSGRTHVFSARCGRLLRLP